jgi:hypothetical protein
MKLGAGSTYLFLDPLPDDSGHFVTVQVDNWLVDLYFLEGLSKSSSGNSEFGNHFMMIA